MPRLERGMTAGDDAIEAGSGPTLSRSKPLRALLPPASDSRKVLQNQAFLEPPENDGGAPRCSTSWDAAAARVAIIETPAEARILKVVEVG